MTTTVCYVAGKSAGHILPCLTEAHRWQKENTDNSILFFATTAPLDRKILADTGTNNVFLPLQRVPYRQPWLLPLFACQSAVSFVKSFYHLWRTRPEKVVSMGGLVSIPVCLAAKLLRIPIELHELNVMPGKTIKFLAPLAHKINVCFEESKNYLPAHKCTVKNYPVRFAPELKKQSQSDALKKLGLSPHKKTIFVLGGSQGSLFINGLIKNWVTQHKNLGKSAQLIHQTGAIQ